MTAGPIYACQYIILLDIEKLRNRYYNNLDIKAHPTLKFTSKMDFFSKENGEKRKIG